MLKRYRASASYGSLNNRCLPYTLAITDNSKFNLSKIADIYVDVNQETAETHTKLSRRNNNRISKDDDSRGKQGGSRTKSCESSECSTCGV